MSRMAGGPLIPLAVPAALLAAPPVPPLPAPLEPGEGLAVLQADGSVRLSGEAEREQPMGSLAKLVWLKLEGAEWSAQGLEFRCTGTLDGHACWLKTGHKRVDLRKATRESCNLAFLAWAQASAARWRKEYGESVARYRLEEAFGPFLGRRLPPGDSLPVLGPEWIGDGELLRTSPKAFLAWLARDDQEPLRILARRLLTNEFTGFYDESRWWFKTGTGPVLGEAATSAWVVGSDGRTLAVLHVPRGRGKVEGLARFRAVMGLPPR